MYDCFKLYSFWTLFFSQALSILLKIILLVRYLIVSLNVATASVSFFIVFDHGSTLVIA